jgi:hypothetical protein
MGGGGGNVTIIGDEGGHGREEVRYEQATTLSTPQSTSFDLDSIRLVVEMME